MLKSHKQLFKLFESFKKKQNSITFMNNNLSRTILNSHEIQTQKVFQQI